MDKLFAHVASGPGFLFELPVEESAQVIEEIKETEMAEADKGRGIGEKKHINTGSPEGWSASEAHTKVYRNRMNRESRKFLREFLKDGPKELHEIRNAALAAGLTWYQVEKASTSLKIVKKLHGPRYPGTWELPESGKRENMVEALKDAGYREVPSPAERAWTPSTLIPPGKGGGLIAPPVSAEANGEPRNADPGPGTYPPPEPASRGIVSPDVSPAAGQDFQSLHRSPFALGIANLVEQELTFRVKEWIEKAERLEREKSGLLQQLADMQHEHDRNWDKIQQEALEAAQKSVAEAIAAAKKR